MSLFSSSAQSSSPIAPRNIAAQLNAASAGVEDLWAHQSASLAKMLERERNGVALDSGERTYGGVLSDQVGAGKTLLMCALVASHRGELHTASTYAGVCMALPSAPRLPAAAAPPTTLLDTAARRALALCAPVADAHLRALIDTYARRAAPVCADCSDYVQMVSSSLSSSSTSSSSVSPSLLLSLRLQARPFERRCLTCQLAALPAYVVAEGVSRRTQTHATLHMTRATLVIAPRSLLPHWRAEAVKLPTRLARTPLRVASVDSGAQLRQFSVDACLLRADLLLVATELVSASEAARHLLRRIHWRRVIVDEGHVAARSASSNIGAAVRALAAAAKWLVTATPSREAPRRQRLFAAVASHSTAANDALLVSTPHAQPYTLRTHEAIRYNEVTLPAVANIVLSQGEDEDSLLHAANGAHRAALLRNCELATIHSRPVEAELLRKSAHYCFKMVRRIDEGDAAAREWRPARDKLFQLGCEMWAMPYAVDRVHACTDALACHGCRVWRAQPAAAARWRAAARGGAYDEWLAEQRHKQALKEQQRQQQEQEQQQPEQPQPPVKRRRVATTVAAAADDEHASCSTKLRFALQLIRDYVQKGEQVIVVAEHDSAMAWLTAALSRLSCAARGFSFVEYHSEAVDRAAQVELFQTGRADVILVLGAILRDGLDFPNARAMIFLSPVYEPSQFDQATGRIRRFSQARATLNVHVLFTAATIEDARLRAMPEIAAGYGVAMQQHRELRLALTKPRADADDADAAAAVADDLNDFAGIVRDTRYRVLACVGVDVDARRATGGCVELYNNGDARSHVRVVDVPADAVGECFFDAASAEEAARRAQFVATLRAGAGRLCVEFVTTRAALSDDVSALHRAVVHEVLDGDRLVRLLVTSSTAETTTTIKSIDSVRLAPTHLPPLVVTAGATPSTPPLTPLDVCRRADDGVWLPALQLDAARTLVALAGAKTRVLRVSAAEYVVRVGEPLATMRGAARGDGRAFATPLFDVYGVTRVIRALSRRQQTRALVPALCARVEQVFDAVELVACRATLRAALSRCR